MTTAELIQQATEVGRALWDEGSRSPQRNISETERMASSVGGAVLALSGLRRGGASGLALIGLGAALVHRGVTGHCKVYDALGMNTSEACSVPSTSRGETSSLASSPDSPIAVP